MLCSLVLKHSEELKVISQGLKVKWPPEQEYFIIRITEKARGNSELYMGVRKSPHHTDEFPVKATTDYHWKERKAA